MLGRKPLLLQEAAGERGNERGVEGGEAGKLDADFLGQYSLPGERSCGRTEQCSIVEPRTPEIKPPDSHATAGMLSCSGRHRGRASSNIRASAEEIWAAKRLTATGRERPRSCPRQRMPGGTSRSSIGQLTSSL